MQLALRACVVEFGTKVVANVYTLTLLPRAIHYVKGVPIFVEIDDDHRIDLEILINKSQNSGANYFFLSYMRGHIAGMDKIASFCSRVDLTLIVDCVQTLGSKWRGIRSGNFGLVSIFLREHINILILVKVNFLRQTRPN